MIKAIALDIDGTITYSDRKLDITAVEPIRKAVKSGLLVCLATGNISCYAQATATLLGINGPLIAEDGGIVYNPETDEEHLLGGVGKVDEGVELLKKEFGNIEPTTSYDIRKTGRTLERTISAEEATKVFKENNLDLTIVDSKFALHIKESGVNKGKALEKVSSIIEFPLSEIAAVGDGENDIEMLKTAGLSFAPANASKKAKKASNYVTTGSYGTGAKEVIEKILNNY